MKTTRTLLFLLLTFFAYTTSFAQTLHIIGVQDNTDPELGTAIDVKHMQNFVAKVKEQTLMNLNAQFFSKTDFRNDPVALGSKVRGLNVGGDDVVIFYYTGHGFNPEGSDFSSFKLSGNGDYRTYNMDKVHAILKEKNPRLLITIYDACNYHERMDMPFVVNRAPDEQLAFQKLFLLAEGEIKVASNTAGYRGFSYSSPRVGGVFSNALLSAINLAIGGEAEEVTWENILKITRKNVHDSTRNVSTGAQIPYYVEQVTYADREEEGTPETNTDENENW